MGHESAPKSSDAARPRAARVSTDLITAALCVSGFLVCCLVCSVRAGKAVRKAQPRRQAARWKARSRRVGTVTATSAREEECESDDVYSL